MRGQISRRDFLKLGPLSFAALAFRWPANPIQSVCPPYPKNERPVAAARVTTHFIYLYQDPDFNSERAGTVNRDQILQIYEIFRSPKGPSHNPRWYRVKGGFAHSAYLQRVENASLNPPLESVPETGQLGEITVPFTQSMRWTRSDGWKPLYRLYYTSVYWITGIDEGPDGKPWYWLTDDLLHVQYAVPASHVRPIPAEELSPISPDVPSQDKRIKISIRDQSLTAFEGDQVVLQTKIASGIPSNGPTINGIPTATPEGYFHIEVKLPSRHMGDGELTDELEAYELPGVPWVSFFHITGVALHGTYWHDNFGRMMSHGCVNMRTEDAKWIYRWSAPAAGPQDWNSKGHGTLVHVYNE